VVALAAKFASHNKQLVVVTGYLRRLSSTLLCFLRDNGDHARPVSIHRDDGSNILAANDWDLDRVYTMRNSFFQQCGEKSLVNEDHNQAFLFAGVLFVAQQVRGAVGRATLQHAECPENVAVKFNVWRAHRMAIS
jgi:hypothetical protein